GSANGFYTFPHGVCIYQNLSLCVSFGNHSFFLRVLHERWCAGGWQSQHHIVCVDKCHDHPFKLYINPITAYLMIEVNDVHKSFGDTEVLKGISTTFEKGK